MIDKFMHGFLNRVYGYDDYTQLEINSKLIQKIDEVIDECNNAFEFLDWLKEQSVPDEVQMIIDTMLEDGTLEKLINIEKLNQISSQLNSNIDNLTNETEYKLNQMNNTMNTKIEENKNELETTIDNFEKEINAELKVIKNIKVCINLEQFKNAIKSAEDKSTIIYLVHGDYILDSTIYIPSNTKIIGLGKVTIKANGLNAYFVNKTNGRTIGYNGTKNITIENITFDGLDSVDGLTLIGIGHAENVLIENCEFKNLHSWNMIEFNAVFNGYIRNCKFENYGNVGSNGTEAVQLGAMINKEQFPWFGNYDNVANKHIIIECNNFSNIGSKCIGNHGFGGGIVQKDIIINNNTFDNVHTAISINDFESLNATNNTSSSCRIFLITENKNNDSKYLNIVGNTHRGNYGNSEKLGEEFFISINKGGNHENLRVEHVNITNNHVTSCSAHGIIYTANFVKVANNDFSNIAWHGVYHFGGLCASICNNTFKYVGKEDDRYAIFTGTNTAEKAEGIIINGNSIANLRGIRIDSNSFKVVVSSNIGQITNNVTTECTTVNNMFIG